jgi:DNA-3-methyladenine glycosylase I
MEAYHDDEWGVPLHSENGLFELLTLEGAQAGLSWSTILRRRAGYRRAFADFDINAVAGFADPDVARLLADSGIIRHRQKVASTLQNARHIQAIQRELGSFDQFVWSFVQGQPVVHAPQTLADVPTQTPESVALSKALRQRGFGFVGPTICYAFMQACGLVNDHVVTCPRFAQLTR